MRGIDLAVERRVEGERLTERLRLHEPPRRRDDAGQCTRDGEASFHDASILTAPAAADRGRQG
jgi:hypothetical protein